jgi:hypothetical protein
MRCWVSRHLIFVHYWIYQGLSLALLFISNQEGEKYLFSYLKDQKFNNAGYRKPFLHEKLSAQDTYSSTSLHHQPFLYCQELPSEADDYQYREVIAFVTLGFVQVLVDTFSQSESMFCYAYT